MRCWRTHPRSSRIGGARPAEGTVKVFGRSMGSDMERLPKQTDQHHIRRSGAGSRIRVQLGVSVRTGLVLYLVSGPGQKAIGTESGHLISQLERDAGRKRSARARRGDGVSNCAKDPVDTHRHRPTQLTQKPSISNACRRPPTPESRSQSRCATGLRHAPSLSQQYGEPKIAVGPFGW